MIAALIISAFLIVVASLVILRTKRPPSQEDADYLPPGFPTQGLFGGGAVGSLGDGHDAGPHESVDESVELERRLLERASRGEKEVLRDAHAAGRPELYRLVLDELMLKSVRTEEDLHSLATFVTRNEELRASPALAERLLEVWRQNPTRSTTVRLLRVAALSDDAEVFERAVTTLFQSWQGGALDGMSAEELRSLFEGEYWLLSSEAKRSGAGFVLKQRLADVRRELANRPRRDNPPSGEASAAEGFTKEERP